MSLPWLEPALAKTAEAARPDPPAQGDPDPDLDDLKRRWTVEHELDRLGLTVPRSRKVNCPLPDHDDGTEARHASFHVYPRPEEGWHCFGCDRGGSVVDLIALLAGRDPRSTDGRRYAVDQLRDRLGVERPVPEVTVLRADRPDWGDVPPPDAPPDEPPARPLKPALEVADVAQVAAEIDAAGDPGYLLSPVWPADAYGVLAAEDKAGKTWAALDAAVAVATGGQWLGRFPCDRPGPVLLFLGEGGQRKMIRRLRAVSAATGVRLEDLPLRLCFRVPHLTDARHLEAMAAELEAHPARLVIVDPLYLAARGAKGSDLYDMGGHLEAVQHIAQTAGAALMVVTHWNKTGEGRGAKRITGVGPGAWGRVLVSGHVESRRTEPDRSTVAVLAWDVIGDEVADLTARVQRRVWTDDPDSLTSPMHYELSAVADDEAADDPPGTELRPAARRVREILRDTDEALTVRDIGDRAADRGRPLKARTIQAALADLKAAGLADSADNALGLAHEWRSSEPRTSDGDQEDSKWL